LSPKQCLGGGRKRENDAQRQSRVPLGMIGSGEQKSAIPKFGKTTFRDPSGVKNCQLETASFATDRNTLALYVRFAVTDKLLESTKLFASAEIGRSGKPKRLTLKVTNKFDCQCFSLWERDFS